MSARQKIGGCRLERVQSRSEHSELYRAYSEELHQPVMMKFLAPRYPPGSKTAQRFLRGGKLALELEHPNIVRTFAAGADKERPYMLMEFVPGHSLDRILKVKTKLPWEMAVGIVRQAAKALALAERRKIVHRKIEPAHIMLSPGGRVTVLGFGLARPSQAQSGAITMEGSLVNITPYTAPEMGEGVPDTRADLYSVGCTLYHLLSGRAPFEGRDPLELLRMHRTEQPWPIEDLVPGLPGGVVALVETLLQKDLGQRLQSPRQLIASVDAAVNPDILGAHGIRPDKTLVTSTIEMLAVRQKQTALVCDDQEYTLRCLRETMRQLGTNVLTARDGRAAVDALQKRNVDLVVTDLKLPRLSGEELLQAFHRARKETPVVLTRTGGLAETMYRKKTYPILACLARPLDLFALRQAAQGVFKG